MKSVHKTLLFCRNKTLSIIMGFAILMHAPVCLAQNGALEHDGQAVSSLNQSSQGSLSKSDDVDIKISNKLISVNFTNAFLRNVLNKIATQSGVNILVSDSVKPERITAHFEMLPMVKALHRLLGGSSYILIKDDISDAATVTGVYVLPRGDGESLNRMFVVGDSRLTESEVLGRALKSDLMPENIKDAMLDQVRMNTRENQQSVSTMRNQAIYKFLERIEKVGAADARTIRQLREKYELMKTMEKIE